MDHEDDSELMLRLPAPDDDRPDARAEQAEAVARYKTALLYEESGLSLEEIAVITAVGPETAKSRLRYAMSKLRQALGTTVEAGPAAAPVKVVPGRAP